MLKCDMVVENVKRRKDSDSDQFQAYGLPLYTDKQWAIGSKLDEKIVGE